MSKWITHRLPTAEDGSRFGEVAVALERETIDGVVVPGENYRILLWHGVASGARWYPLNKEAAEAAEAEQAAMAEQKAAAAAAANPDPTPEPAAEPSPAVAGVPSDQELWRVQREACKQAQPILQWKAWHPGDTFHPGHVAAHRALYDYGYRRCLEEAKATREPNKGLHIALQEENAQLKSKIKELHGEIREVCDDSNGIIGLAEAKQRQFDDACKCIAELERENAKLKSDLHETTKDLAHSLSQPQMVFVGDLEGELERRGGEVKLEPTPAPEPAVRKAVQIAGHNNALSVMCDDGTVWLWRGYDGWTLYKTIPQTPIQ
jgi:hypothetical protein